MDYNGDRCDFLQDCDSYLRIIVNGQEVWRSHTEWSESNPEFDETFTMPLSRYANIAIQMWDSDLSSGDDLMSEWPNFSVESLSRYTTLTGHDWGWDKQNYVHIRTQWTPIYNYNFG